MEGWLVSHIRTILVKTTGRMQANMKSAMILVLLLGLIGLAIARRDTYLEFETEDISREEDGKPGNAVEGSYSWTSKEGMKYFVEFVADELGYRIVRSNAIPMTQAGVKADGNQGSFASMEEDNK